MKRLFIIRHSETSGQHEDSPLTKLGMRQSKILSNFLDHYGYEIDKVISSPYLRAKDTIQPFANKKGLEVITDERLKERILSEEPLDDFMEVLEETFTDHDYKMPGGESSNEAKRRVRELVDELEQDEEHDNIAIVTHGNLLALLLQTFHADVGFDQWKRITNPDIYLVQKQGGEYTVERIWRE
ncbi:histidine phosphatase family protein [Thalassobacillus hwangdonensis]|uniref:Histidine phosphatase family protein n=1 Tax=Thalassobacillus hwangdonensis TaxID=546108 RepID=A0ABW3KZ66_9BACI